MIQHFPTCSRAGRSPSPINPPHPPPGQGFPAPAPPEVRHHPGGLRWVTVCPPCGTDPRTPAQLPRGEAWSISADCLVSLRDPVPSGGSPSDTCLGGHAHHHVRQTLGSLGVWGSFSSLQQQGVRKAGVWPVSQSRVVHLVEGVCPFFLRMLAFGVGGACQRAAAPFTPQPMASSRNSTRHPQHWGPGDRVPTLGPTLGP